MGATAVSLAQTIDKLIRPIPGEHPSGESLRYEGAYDRIGEARREDDPTLTQGVWKSALKKADWSEVEKLCVQELQTRTKDLQIAAWLSEAWLHLYGFEGVREGLELLRDLVDGFWADLYPQVADGDLEYRIAPITWINEKLSIQLRLLPITSPESEDILVYSWSDWENACRTEINDPKLPKMKPSAESQQPQLPKLTPSDFEQSVIYTPTPFFAGLAEQVGLALQVCSELESSLDRLCGKQTPSLRQFYGVLDSVHAFLLSTLAQRSTDDTIALAPARRTAEPANGEVPTVLASGAITSRDEAYRRLAEAAEYLSRIEPHSPAPYLVKRAILWGSLSLPELLRELVRNQGELSEIFRLLELGDGKKN